MEYHKLEFSLNHLRSNYLIFFILYGRILFYFVTIHPIDIVL